MPDFLRKNRGGDMDNVGKQGKVKNPLDKWDDLRQDIGKLKKHKCEEEKSTQSDTAQRA